MALTVKELLNAVQTSEDFQKRGTMVRRFLVTTRDHKSARIADGVPGIRSSHPDNPAYILDNISTTASGSGHTYVDCAYSNDRRFYAREVDKDLPTWYHWGWGSRDVEVKFYIDVKEKVNFSDQSSPVDMWNLKETRLLETRLVRPLFVRLERVSDIRWLDPIRVQKNKVHLMPDGVHYRFLGGDVSQKDDSTFDVKYEWELDEGTPMPVIREPDLQGFRNRVFVPTDPLDGGLLRSPYFSLVPACHLPTR